MSVGNTSDNIIIPMYAVKQKGIMDAAEWEVERVSYANERYYYHLVGEGNVDEIKRLHKVSTIEDVMLMVDEKAGRMGLNRLKHFEYAICSSIAFCARSAIEGGVDALNAYALHDAYLQSLEKARGIGDILRIGREAHLDFAFHVREIKEQARRSLYVERCKSFIANNLNRYFTLGDVAGAAGISKSYLGRLFLTHEHMSVMEYVRRERVKGATVLLRYSDESISDISAYLCFPSQSHFGMVFKNVMGITPLQYRKKHKLVDLQHMEEDSIKGSREAR